MTFSAACRSRTRNEEPSNGWVGLCVPKKTPAPIVEKLREVAKKVVEDKEYIDIIEKLGDEVRYMVGDDLTKYWDSESERVARLYKQMIAEK